MYTHLFSPSVHTLLVLQSRKSQSYGQAERGRCVAVMPGTLAGQGRAGQGRAGQGRARRSRAGQGRAGEGVSTDQRHKASSLTGMMCKGLASVV